MQKDKSVVPHKLLCDILDGKAPGKTTEPSAQNQAWGENRKSNTRIRKAPKGRMLTQKEMATLRRIQQVYPGDIQADADSLRGFKVS